jgi:hypothetical protein
MRRSLLMAIPLNYIAALPVKVVELLGRASYNRDERGPAFLGDAMDDQDLPMISLPTESTSEGMPAVNESKAQPAAEPRRNPTTEIRRPGPAPAPARPAPAPQAADPRKASEMRKPGVPLPPPASRPAPAAEPADEDPEKLLRQYAEQQKTKVQRLEQQLVELKRVQAERDALRAKSEALARELGEARKQLEAAAKSDEIILDLQGKVDAALLSSSMEKDELTKLKARADALEAGQKRAEERASHAEKSLAEAQRSLASQTEGRKDAESRVAQALQALQGEHVSRSATVRVPPAEPTPGRPAEKHATAHAAAPKPVVNFVKK